MIGEKLKELRETKGLKQMQVAAELDVANAKISKIESNGKPVIKAYLTKLSFVYNVDEYELFTLWLADKEFHIVNDQDGAFKAIEAVVEEIRVNAKENYEQLFN